MYLKIKERHEIVKNSSLLWHRIHHPLCRLVGGSSVGMIFFAYILLKPTWISLAQFLQHISNNSFYSSQVKKCSLCATHLFFILLSPVTHFTDLKNLILLSQCFFRSSNISYCLYYCKRCRANRVKYFLNYSSSRITFCLWWKT